MKKVCKFKRYIKSGDQYRLCTKRECNFAENVAYHWRNVNCPKCLKLRGEK